MSTLNIIKDYTSGKVNLEDTNAALKAENAGFYLDPGKNALTEEEIQNTTIGTYPNQANGWGLLDTGTGTMDKVEIRGGELVSCDCSNMPAMVIIAGRDYYVDGNKLVTEKPGTPAAEHVPDTPDISRRKDLAGKTVEQKTASGIFMVTYDDLGYVKKASRK